jgi:putative oxidoreductase
MKQFTKLSALENFEEYRPDPAFKGIAISVDPQSTLTRNERIVSWILRAVAAAIMLETLFFKFTGAPESIYIFSRMNMEPWWRYGQGAWELIASILLLTPRFAWAGGILTLGALGAAIVSHLTILGIQIQGDRGLLFAMATVAFTSALVVTYLHRDEIPAYEPTSLY